MSDRGDVIFGLVLLGGIGLFFGFMALGTAGAVKDVTEDLVYQEHLGPLHVLKIWEGEFSIEFGKLRKYHWRLEDLDGKHVTQGYADTLDEAHIQAMEAVPT